MYYNNQCLKQRQFSFRLNQCDTGRLIVLSLITDILGMINIAYFIKMFCSLNPNTLIFHSNSNCNK